MMDSSETITQWIANLQQGKDETRSQQEIWNRYFARLTALARAKLRSAPHRVADDEDVVLEALNSFFDGVSKGRFPQLTDRQNLWPLLAKITARKAINQQEYLNAQKRGGETCVVNRYSSTATTSRIERLDWTNASPTI
jgi:DNA-directed RNA polymerase specialized sigma24 family protein